MSIVPAAALAVVALLGAGPDLRAAPAEGPTVDPSALFSGGSLDLRTMTLPRARALGPVLRETTKPLPKDWFDGDGELRTVALEGLELEFAVPRGRAPFLTRATLSDPRWELRGGIRVGAPFDLVRRALGEGRRDGDLVRYDGGEAPDWVEVAVEKGVVARLTLVPYSG